MSKVKSLYSLIKNNKINSIAFAGLFTGAGLFLIPSPYQSVPRGVELDNEIKTFYGSEIRVSSALNPVFRSSLEKELSDLEAERKNLKRSGKYFEEKVKYEKDKRRTNLLGGIGFLMIISSLTLGFSNSILKDLKDKPYIDI